MQNIRKKVVNDENQAEKENNKPKSEKKIWRTPLQDITNTFGHSNFMSPFKNNTKVSSNLYSEIYTLQQNKPASKSAFKQIR